MLRGRDEQVIAVRFLARDERSADLAAGAGLVLNHDGRLQLIAQVLSEAARNQIRETARRKRDDDGDGFAVGPIGGGRDSRREQGVAAADDDGGQIAAQRDAMQLLVRHACLQFVVVIKTSVYASSAAS
ncbi:hypothetical protein D3C77_503330 [compost metagenome]